MSDRVRLAREIAARTKPRLIEIPREKRSGVPFTEEQLTGYAGRLTAEENGISAASAQHRLACSRHSTGWPGM